MKVPAAIIPLLIVLLTAMGLNGTRYFRVPSAETILMEEPPGVESDRAVFIVDGVSCRDTALTAMGSLSGLSGVYRAEAYASYNRIDVVYNPDAVGTARIKEAFENPVFMSETGEFIFDMFHVIEINGKRIEAKASNNKEDSL